MAWAGNPKIHRKASGTDHVRMVYRPEASGQSYKKGQFVYEVAGALTECATDCLILLGIAQQDATGTAGSSSGLLQAVELVYPGDVLEIQTTAAVTQAMAGITYALTTTSNVNYIDCTDTGHDFATLEEPKLTGAGALQAYGFFTIPAIVCQTSGTAGA